MRNKIVGLMLFISTSSLALESWNMNFKEIIRWRGQYYDLAIDGDILYLACKRGIEMYSIVDPANPQLLGAFFTKGLANGIAINYPYAYVGDVYGFSVWNISDPSNPHELGGFERFREEGYQERIYYRDGYVLAAAYSSGLQVIDVSDPADPVIVAEEDTPAYAWDMAVKDNVVYVMDFFSMEIIDISRINAPLNRSSFEAMFAGGIAVQDEYAYLAYIDGIRVLDIADPFNPKIIAEPGPTGSGAGEAISVQGAYAYLAHSSYVEIYDISIPSEPLQVGFFYPPGHPRKLLAHDQYLFTILDDNGFYIADVSDPASPTNFKHVDPSIWGNRQEVLARDDLLYLCDWSRGLVIYDASDPESLREIATYSTPGVLNEIFVVGNKAYLSCYSEMQVLDVTDPASPVFLGAYRTTGNPWSAYITGDRAYLCDIYSFQIVDVSDPADMERIGVIFLADNGSPLRCVVRDTAAFVAHSYAGLTVIDIADPTHPRILYNYNGGNSRNYSTLTLSGNHLYLLDSSAGIDILDLSDVVNPVLLNTVSFQENQFADFELHDNHLLFLASSSNGVQVVDVNDVLNPVLVGRADTPGDAIGISATADRIFVADDYDLCVLSYAALTPDSRAPQVQITQPVDDAAMTGKLPLIRGRAFDEDSGIRYVEISLDGGQTWQLAKGQESWSCFANKRKPGRVNVIARTWDWSGNSKTSSAIVAYLDPDIPEVFLAGFESSRASQSSSNFKASAIVKDPYDPDYLANVVLKLDGSSDAMNLSWQYENSGFVYFVFEGSATASSGSELLFTIQANDNYENPSYRWPYFTVRD